DEGPYISRIQGYFFVEEHNLFFEDRSKNGTFVNNKLIKGETIQVRIKDRLKFGNITCEIVE
ncbi:MAG TPA: FHA domain-containing protein, partial [Spirochaetota bacterium]|nr:FHA domain-containing protein [Spirochaetota bacterium]